MSAQLGTLTLRGYKTIRELKDFRPGPLTVLIGANGSGKSNFISFFRLLSWMTARDLEVYVGLQGGASKLLHDGPKVTRDFEAELSLATDVGRNDYAIRLSYAADDKLVFAEEKYRFSRVGLGTLAPWTGLGAGHYEASIIAQAEGVDTTARVILGLLRRIKVYQFHDTSATARIRGKWSADDGGWLREDGANLGSFLLRLREEAPAYYGRIVETVRQIAPFFTDFVLEPEHGQVLLRWQERGTDAVFSVSQASDGTLRTLALLALLGQPEGDLPNVLVLDEPELGLHPSAIGVVAGMIHSASMHAQVILATQSVALVDQFEPEQIVVVDRRDRESVFARLDPEKLKDWLEEYRISELWEKNVIGGTPA